MGLRKKLWLLCGALLSLSIAMGALGLWAENKMNNALTEQIEVHINAVRLMTLVDMMHDGIRANVFAARLLQKDSDPKEVEGVIAERDQFAKNMKEHMKNLQALKIPLETQELISVAVPQIDSYVQEAYKISEAAVKHDDHVVEELSPRFAEAFSSLEESLGKLGDKIETGAENSGIMAKKEASTAVNIQFIALALGILSGVILTWTIMKQMTTSMTTSIQNLNQNGSTVNSTATSLGALSIQLADSVRSQAAALQETAASVDEISSMVQRTADNSSNLVKSAEAGKQSANNGKNTIARMQQAIGTIHESNDLITSQINAGNARIREIVSVISEIGAKTKVINDIVFQTKLLSFNASVEAARAGEHGKGFAVVAEEVGNLAQMSGNAAKEITNLLDSSIDKVESIIGENQKQIEGILSEAKSTVDTGHKLAADCGEDLNRIVENTAQVTSLIADINSAIHDQTSGIKEISKALNLLDRTMNESSAVSSKTAEDSKLLLAESHKLSDVVRGMQILFDGNSGLEGTHATTTDAGHATHSHSDASDSHKHAA